MCKWRWNCSWRILLETEHRRACSSCRRQAPHSREAFPQISLLHSRRGASGLRAWSVRDATCCGLSLASQWRKIDVTLRLQSPRSLCRALSRPFWRKPVGDLRAIAPCLGARRRQFSLVCRPASREHHPVSLGRKRRARVACHCRGNRSKALPQSLTRGYRARSRPLSATRERPSRSCWPIACHGLAYRRGNPPICLGRSLAWRCERILRV